MDRLWSPWRSSYVTAPADRDEACIFCEQLAAGDDTETGVLYRTDATFVLLNAFPYNTGHVMVAPRRHIAELHDLDDVERHELMVFSVVTI